MLFTRSALASGRLWLARACCFRPPDARCIVRRRERVVVIIPICRYYCGAHSHRVNIDIGILIKLVF